MTDRQFYLIFGSFFAGIGSIFFVVGLGFLQHTRTFLATAHTAPGRVIAVERRRSEDGSSYYPVVQFTEANGELVQFEGLVGSNPPAHRVGESVEVLYDPAKPQSARIHSWFDLWFVPTVFSGIGGVFTLIGGVVLVLQFWPH